MPRDARVETGALRLRLMAGAAAVALATWNGAAQAQDAPVVTAPQTPGADGLPPEAIYLEADTAARTGDLITATGGSERVLARFRNTTLRAGRLSYDLEAGVATADDRLPQRRQPDGGHGRATQ